MVSVFVYGVCGVFVCMCVYACVCVYVCVYVCVCVCLFYSAFDDDILQWQVCHAKKKKARQT